MSTVIVIIVLSFLVVPMVFITHPFWSGSLKGLKPEKKTPSRQMIRLRKRLEDIDSVIQTAETNRKILGDSPDARRYDIIIIDLYGEKEKVKSQICEVAYQSVRDKKKELTK